MPPCEEAEYAWPQEMLVRRMGRLLDEVVFPPQVEVFINRLREVFRLAPFPRWRSPRLR